MHSVQSSPPAFPALHLGPLILLLHPMLAWFKTAVTPSHYLPSLLSTSLEPTTVSQALSNPQWKSPMQADFDALLANNTWTLAQLPHHRSAIGYKWVFLIKEISDRAMNKYKTRLIYKGILSTTRIWLYRYILTSCETSYYNNSFDISSH